jgi:hypothetical protein
MITNLSAKILIIKPTAHSNTDTSIKVFIDTSPILVLIMILVLIFLRILILKLVSIVT